MCILNFWYHMTIGNFQVWTHHRQYSWLDISRLCFSLTCLYAGPLPYHAIWQWPLPNVSACQQYGNQMSKRQQTSSDGTFTSTSIDGNWMNMRRETSLDGTLRQQQKIEIKWAIDHHQWLQKSYWYALLASDVISFFCHLLKK